MQDGYGPLTPKAAGQAMFAKANGIGAGNATAYGSYTPADLSLTASGTPRLPLQMGKTPTMTESQWAWYDSLSAGDNAAGKPVPSNRYTQQIAADTGVPPTAGDLQTQTDRLNSPSLNELHGTPFTSEQLKSFVGKDAYFFAQRQTQLAASEQPMAGPVWSFREASMAQRRLDDALAAVTPNYAPAATVGPTYKAISSAIGMVADGLGVIAGGAMTIAGAGLTAAPEPTTLTKWAGVPLTAFGATYTAKSAVGFGLNFTNFVTALKGSTSESAYMPGSALEWAVRASGGSPEAERVAMAADMAWGLAGGRVLDARLVTGVVTNPRVAALLQPALVTSVDRQTTILAPNAWNAIMNRPDFRGGYLV